jgi:hypothetical protein
VWVHAHISWQNVCRRYVLDVSNNGSGSSE